MARKLNFFLHYPFLVKLIPTILALILLMNNFDLLDCASRNGGSKFRIEKQDVKPLLIIPRKERSNLKNVKGIIKNYLEGYTRKNPLCQMTLQLIDAITEITSTMLENEAQKHLLPADNNDGELKMCQTEVILTPDGMQKAMVKTNFLCHHDLQMNFIMIDMDYFKIKTGPGYLASIRTEFNKFKNFMKKRRHLEIPSGFNYLSLKIMLEVFVSLELPRSGKKITQYTVLKVIKSINGRITTYLEQKSHLKRLLSMKGTRLYHVLNNPRSIVQWSKRKDSKKKR